VGRRGEKAVGLVALALHAEDRALLDFVALHWSVALLDFSFLVPKLAKPLAATAESYVFLCKFSSLFGTSRGAPNALQQLQNELQDLQRGVVLAGKTERELRRMRKNLRGASSADDNE
jgi:hypothetical protein